MNRWDLNHGRSALADGRETFHRVDTTEIAFGHVQARVAELPLEAVERDTLPARLDREAVPELVRRDPSAQSAPTLERGHLPAHIGRRHLPTSERSANHRDQRSAGDLLSDGEPVFDFGPAPLVHDDDPAFVALTVSDDDGAFGAAQIKFVEREGFTDPQAGAVQDHEQASESHGTECCFSSGAKRFAVLQHEGEFLGPDRFGREFAAPVGVVRLAERDYQGKRTGAKLSLARHGGCISLMGRGSDRWRGHCPTFYGSAEHSGSTPAQLGEQGGSCVVSGSCFPDGAGWVSGDCVGVGSFASGWGRSV